MVELRIVFMLFVSVFYAQNKQIELAPFFQDGMVVQQNKPIVIWGTASKNQKIHVDFDGVGKDAVADIRGEWSVVYKPQRASFKAKELKVNDLVVKNILIGELWLFSGQSNLVMDVQWDGGVKDKMISSSMSHIRFLNFAYPLEYGTKRDGAFSDEALARSNEKDYFDVQWQVLSDTNISKQSAAGYYFAKELYEKLNVPVGVILTAVGGASLSSWLPKEVLLKDSIAKTFYEGDWLKNKNAGGNVVRMKRAFINVLEKGKPYIIGKTPYRFMCEPDFLFSAAMYKIEFVSLAGVVWYQGESDAGNKKRIKRYEDMLPSLFSSWRSYFRDKKLPFVVMQLPRYNKKSWSDMRIAQATAVSKSKNVSLVPIIDTGDIKDIHPHDKNIVGQRLGYKVLNDVYHVEMKNFIEIKKMVKKKNKLKITFRNYGKEILLKESSKSGFEVVNDENRILCSLVKTGKNTVEVVLPSSEVEVLHYLYEAFPEPILFSSDSIPLPPSILRF